jgi:hypothetical protein
MDARIVLRVDAGIMPKSGRNRKPLNVYMDGMIIGDIGWGQTAQYNVSPGTHEISVILKLGGPAVGLAVDARDGETALVRCYFDMGGEGLALVNEKDKAAHAALKAQARTNGSVLAAKTFAYLIGGISVFLGVLNLLLNNGLFGLMITGTLEKPAQFLGDIGLLGPDINGIYWLGIGVVFLVLGVLIKRRSLPALTAATLLYGADGCIALFSLFALAKQFGGHDLSFVGPFVLLFFSVVFHVLILIQMGKAIFYLAAAKRRKTQTPPQPTAKA